MARKLKWFVKVGGEKIAAFACSAHGAKFAAAQIGYAELYCSGPDGGLVGQWQDGIPTPEFQIYWDSVGGNVADMPKAA